MSFFEDSNSRVLRLRGERGVLNLKLSYQIMVCKEGEGQVEEAEENNHLVGFFSLSFSRVRNERPFRVLLLSGRRK